MPTAVAELSSPLLELEGPLHSLRGLALLLHDIGDSEHEVEQDACEALVSALQVVHAELRNA